MPLTSGADRKPSATDRLVARLDATSAKLKGQQVRGLATIQQTHKPAASVAVVALVLSLVAEVWAVAHHITRDTISNDVWWITGDIWSLRWWLTNGAIDGLLLWMIVHFWFEKAGVGDLLATVAGLEVLALLLWFVNR